jgi:uncharacterized protein
MAESANERQPDDKEPRGKGPEGPADYADDRGHENRSERTGSADAAPSSGNRPEAEPPATPSQRSENRNSDRDSADNPRPVGGTPGSPGNEPSPVELQDEDFIPDESVADESVFRDDVPPGPGLPESILWSVGVVLVHLFAGILMLGVATMIHVATVGSPDDARDMRRLMVELQERYTALIIGGDQLLFLLVVMAAVALRLYPGVYRKLGLSPIPLWHYMLIPVMVLPLSLCSGELYRRFMALVEELIRLMPGLEFVQDFQTMEALQRWAQDIPLATLILIIAVAPAVSEELVFRGLIGRGLIARWGVPAGIAITSVLFAVVHMHPAHALALLPLAVFIHLLHVATRSLWAPILLHFLNNAWAAVATKHADRWAAEGMQGFDVERALPTGMLLTSIAAILSAGALIWKTRLEFYFPDGRRWNPGYAAVEPPPDHLPLEPRSAAEAGTIPLIGLTAVSLLAFYATVRLGV